VNCLPDAWNTPKTVSHSFCQSVCPSVSVGPPISQSVRQRERERGIELDRQSVSQFASMSCLKGVPCSVASVATVAMCCVNCQRIAWCCCFWCCFCCCCLCVKALNLYGSVSCQSHLQTVTHGEKTENEGREQSWSWGRQANKVSTKCGQETAQRQHINLCQQEGYTRGKRTRRCCGNRKSSQSRRWQP